MRAVNMNTLLSAPGGCPLITIHANINGTALHTITPTPRRDWHSVICASETIQPRISISSKTPRNAYLNTHSQATRRRHGDFHFYQQSMYRFTCGAAIHPRRARILPSRCANAGDVSVCRRTSTGDVANMHELL